MYSSDRFCLETRETVLSKLKLHEANPFRNSGTKHWRPVLSPPSGFQRFAKNRLKQTLASHPRALSARRSFRGLDGAKLTQIPWRMEAEAQEIWVCVASVAFCSPAKSFTFSGVMQNP